LKYDDTEQVIENFKSTDQSGWKTDMELYGYFHLNKNQFLETSLGANYTNNSYTYGYKEPNYSTLTDSKEDLYDFSVNVNYGIEFNPQSSIVCTVVTEKTS